MSDDGEATIRREPTASFTITGPFFPNLCVFCLGPLLFPASGDPAGRIMDAANTPQGQAHAFCAGQPRAVRARVRGEG